MTMVYELKSARKARILERFLAMRQVPYYTRILKSRKRGLRYEITVMVDHGSGN